MAAKRVGLWQRVRQVFTRSPDPRSKMPRLDVLPYGTQGDMKAFHPGYYGTGSSSTGSKWPYGLSSNSYVRVMDHYGMRQNAREAYHDTPQARSLVDRYADTVADVGLKLEMQPRASLLGITEEEADAWARDIEERFDAWAQAKQQHRSATMNFYQLQRLYAISQQRDNDMFPRFYYSRSGQLLSPLQFDLYDPNQIRGTSYTTTYGPIGHADGIERNPDGTEAAYQVWYVDSRGVPQYRRIPHIGRRSGLPHMLHGYYSEYAGQRRGYSRLAHALQEFQNITDFELSTIKKAINLANLTLSVENTQQDPSNPFEELGMAEGGAGPASQQFGTGAKDEGSSSVDVNELDINERLNYTPMPEATTGVPGSTGIFNLQRGDKLKKVNDSAAGESFDKFVDAFTAHLAASMSMPLEVLLMKFNANYSASRASLIMFWRIANIWQHEMATDLLNPTVETFITLEIAAGRVSAPGWSDPRLRAAWMNCNWIGAPMPNIDPQRTASADKQYVEMGATTLDRISRNLNGSSGESNRRKLAREFEGLAKPPWTKDWSREGEQPSGQQNESPDQSGA